jgi:hypothetical protein
MNPEEFYEEELRRIQDAEDTKASFVRDLSGLVTLNSFLSKGLQVVSLDSDGHRASLLGRTATLEIEPEHGRLRRTGDASPERAICMGRWEY